MAVTAYGTGPTINALHWSTLHQTMMKGGWYEVVKNAADLAPSVGAGTRAIQVAVGTASVCGVELVVDAPVTVNLDANGAANPRIDYIVLEVDWSGTSSVKFVKGSTAASPSPPTLTKDAGVLWQMPIARILVNPGDTAFVAGDITACTPQQRAPSVYKPSVDLTAVAAAASEREIATVTLPDPGWPYRVELMGAVNFTALTGNGKGIIRGYVDGVEITSGEAAAKNNSPAVLRTDWSAQKTGSVIARLTMTPNGMSGEQLAPQSARTGFTVVVHPV